VVIFGFGRVGQAVLELALTRPWLDVVGIVARRPERDGEAAAAAVPEAPSSLHVRTDGESLLREARPDAAVVATSSRLRDVLPQLRLAAEAGARAIACTSEELAYALPEDGPEARAIHALATEHGAAIVATGVNPGFMMDLWPLVLSGLAWDVESLESRRIVDVSVFAPHTRSQLGIGHDRAAFDAGVADGSIVGHLGFRESLRMLCDAMGRPAERITIDTDPVIAERPYRLSDGTIEKGTTVAASQRAVAWRDGTPWISLEMLLHVAPEQDGVRPIDETHLRGRHELHATLDPGCAAILGTAAQLINTIPTALAADPGLYGPGQLPPSAPWLAQMAPLGGRRPATAVA
jgi:4-hydroxy-tetrahydrodipicolinate reductase